MSYLVDPDIVSLTHQRNLPARLEKWLKANEAECFISNVSIAEMRYSVEIAPAGQREILAARVAERESQFAEAIEHVIPEYLVQWKRIAAQCLAVGHRMATNKPAHFVLLEPLGLEVVNPLK